LKEFARLKIVFITLMSSRLPDSSETNVSDLSTKVVRSYLKFYSA